MSDIRVAEYELGEKVWYKISDDMVDTSEHDAKVRADERKKILNILYRLVKSDYNSKECKLLISDLQEFICDEGQNNE